MNLIQMLSSELKPEMVSELGNLLGTDRGIISKILAAAGPAILSIFAKVGSTGEGASTLFRLLRDNFDPAESRVAGTIGQTGDLQNMTERGRGIIQSLLGGKSETLVNAISSFTGGNTSVVSKLLNYVTGYSGNLLSKEVRTQGLTPSGLQQYLSSQRESVSAAMPAGLTTVLNSMGGLGDLVHAPQGADRLREAERKVHGGDAGRSIPTDRIYSDSSSTDTSWLRGVLPLLLVIAAAGALLWRLIPGDRAPRTASVVNDADRTTERARFDRLDSDAVTITLPNGVVMRNVWRNSAESRISAFLKNPGNDKPDQFVLDRVKIDADNKKVSLDSAQQLDNIAALLMAYPNAKAIVGAPEVEKIALLRKVLVDRGVPASRVTEGEVTPRENVVKIVK